MLLCEMALRFAARGGKVVWATWEARPWQHRELEGVLRRYGIADSVETVVAGVEASRGTRRSLVDASLTRVEALAATSPVALFLFEEEGTAAWVDAALPRCAALADLTLVVRPWVAVTRGEHVPTAPVAPFTAAIQTSRDLAAQGLYPALDPAGTRRRDAAPDPLRQRAAEALAHVDHPVRSVLAQPFYVVEADSGQAGTWTCVADARAAVKAALG